MSSIIPWYKKRYRGKFVNWIIGRKIYLCLVCSLHELPLQQLPPVLIKVSIIGTYFQALKRVMTSTMNGQYYGKQTIKMLPLLFVTCVLNSFLNSYQNLGLCQRKEALKICLLCPLCYIQKCSTIDQIYCTYTTISWLHTSCNGFG